MENDNMIIGGQNFKFVDTFATPIAIADSWVRPQNKTGSGNGEAKLYISNRDVMQRFYGRNGFVAHCFMLKQDLVTYMFAIKNEYLNPSQEYRGKDDMPTLWGGRMTKIQALPDIIEFSVTDQNQIEGLRGYINSNDMAYSLIREIALPYVSYISTMHLKLGKADMFYWRLFADYAEIDRRRDYVLKYGKKEEQKELPKPTKAQEKRYVEYRYAREGQGKYREAMLRDCPFCPITMINEESLLIASHIKPWAASDNKEKIDPKNGFILSPLYDKLFDRGFITFDDTRHVQVSNWLSRQDKGRIGIKDNQLFQFLPIDNDRIKYLEYHRQMVYKG